MKRTLAAALAALAVGALAPAATADASPLTWNRGGRSVAAHDAHRPKPLLWPVCQVNGNGAQHWKWRDDQIVRHCYWR